MTRQSDISEPPMVTPILTKLKENGICAPAERNLYSHIVTDVGLDVVNTVCVVFLADFQRTYTQDGVCLTESGLCQLQSLSVQTTRRRRQKPKLKLKIINQNSVAVLQTPPDPQSELFRDGDVDDCRGNWSSLHLLQYICIIWVSILHMWSSGILVLVLVSGSIPKSNVYSCLNLEV